ncbi:MoaF-related domain-containing protein [Aurantiacibacter sp. D1-12]|uniref:MoaF-related domain-containing protein n=1 Tax=Aurantiacibacter sp. D1-12 TaxID=2993658 RepID=UPI00237C729B|nr:MoaF N-terminal domain-containing protein [Aurantiacibacter sp. D1-12]MDE1467967.1 MoaF N-terminal domain-containing protein [Aurantiacibacter sp. D1-12]
MTKHGVSLIPGLLLPAFLAGCSGQQDAELQLVEIQTEKDAAMSDQVIGNSFKVDFGAPYIFRLNFESETAMSFVQIDESGNEIPDALKGSVETTRVEIRPNVYMVYWSEPFNRDTNVTHVQDFENGRVWTNISTPGEPFVNLNGSLTLIDDAAAQ